MPKYKPSIDEAVTTLQGVAGQLQYLQTFVLSTEASRALDAARKHLEGAIDRASLAAYEQGLLESREV